ncbi:MAG: hypothetical protein KF685_10590 [Acidobacteria bacterium]|nr:hypothetical protein [Acidobacteriota bacterium]
MKEKYIHIAGILIAAVYAVFISFLYAAEPRSLEEVSSKAVTTVENITTKGSVVIGTYEVDKLKFDEGMAAFRSDNFIAARDSFDRADPEKRDPKTQFYIAYSYYRQGWGRVYSDDELYRSALDVLGRVTMLDPNFRSDDNGLLLRTPAELRHELEEGLKVTADDLNPLRVFRERK